MIISKKKFEEAIQKAVDAKESEIFRENQRDYQLRDIWSAIRETERRVEAVEKKVGIERDKSNCVGPTFVG